MSKQIIRNCILVIDDEEEICTSLKFALEDQYDVSIASAAEIGLGMLLKQNFDVILLDLRIGNIDGIDVLTKIMEIDKSINVIMMTAYGSIVSTVDAIKKGAFTYLTKPIDLEVLYKTIEQAIADREHNKRILYDVDIIGDHINYGIIGQSPAMHEVYAIIDKLKNVDTSVVIYGESGTGKELVARAMHFAGKRKDHRFVELNCAAIPENLLEEELFGHKKGAFTGALSDKIGKFEYANHGTMFFDEIGDMPLVLQSKLLRVIQQREYTPIGGFESVKINVRIIAATNRNLKKMVEEGKFRKDLYFRLNVVEVNLPPLRERRQDIRLLMHYYLKMYNERLSKNILGVCQRAENYLHDYDYPGNVRELSNIIECAVLLAASDIIEVDDLPVEVCNKLNDDVLDLKRGIKLGTKNLVGLTLQEAERELILAALKLNKGHRRATATMLGISERGLRNKLNEYNLKTI